MIDFAFPHGRFEARGTWWRSRETFDLDGRAQSVESFLKVTVQDLAYESETAGKMAWLPFRLHVSSSESQPTAIGARVLGLRVPMPGRIARRAGGAVLSTLPHCPFAFDHPAITWRAIDDGRVEASTTSAGKLVSMIYGVETSGQVSSITPEPAPFLPRRKRRLHVAFGDYGERGGVRVPIGSTVTADAGRGSNTARHTVLDWAVIR